MRALTCEDESPFPSAAHGMRRYERDSVALSTIACFSPVDRFLYSDCDTFFSIKRKVLPSGSRNFLGIFYVAMNKNGEFYYITQFSLCWTHRKKLGPQRRASPRAKNKYLSRNNVLHISRLDNAIYLLKVTKINEQKMFVPPATCTRFFNSLELSA